MIILGLPLVYWLVIFSVLIGIGGAYAYIRDTLLGQSKPNRVSWAMWSLAPLIATAAAIASGADLLAAVRIFLAGFLPLLVFLASFLNPRSYWKLTSFDAICGSLSLMAIFVWWGIDSPHLAILLAAAGDGFAAIPTVIKAWKYPETETGLFYIAGFISVILVIPSIPVWNIANSAFQIYLITANALLVLCIYRKYLKYLKIWKN